MPQMGAEARISVSGGADKDVRVMNEGSYSLAGSNSGRNVFKKVPHRSSSLGADDMTFIYYWEDKEDLESTGWWMGSAVGGDTVTAFNTSTSFKCPTYGWRVPFDGDVDPTIKLEHLPSQGGLASVLSQGVSSAAPAPAPALAPAPVPAPADDDDHYNEDFCQVCQKAGKLLLCERCPRAFHVHCIERHIEEEEIMAEGEQWECPICKYGDGVLSGSVGPKLSEAELAETMRSASTRSKRHRGLAHRRRDLFLKHNFELVSAFVSVPARTRILKAGDDDKKLPLVEIGSRVKAVGLNERAAFEAYVLQQTASTRYLVTDAETGVECEIERDMMNPVGRSSGDLFGAEADFFSHARSAVLSEGTNLKEYQKVGVNWLLHAFFNRGGGILADDMGLGKTVQTLACLSWLRSSGNVTGPFCVVCPLSCAGNWIRECKRFVPHMSVAKICGSVNERTASLDNDEIWYGNKDIIVTTYESMKNTENFFQRHFWGCLVLDEAHRIKSEFTAVRQVLDTIQCAGRFLLTGTPLQNNLNELFELLRFLWPEVLAKESEVFQGAVQLPETCLTPAARDKLNGDVSREFSSETIVDESLVGKVHSLLSMLMLRRKKADVISLPPKVLHDLWLPLSPSQVKWYRVLMNCRSEGGEMKKLGIREVFQMVTRLRLNCAHPRCILSNEANKEKLGKYESMDMPALQALADLEMSEEVVAQSAKLSYLDKLLSHLHAQNMGVSSNWRKSFEDRQRKDERGQQQKKKTAAQWLKKAEGILFLEDMSPWQATQAGASRSPAPRPEAATGFSSVVGAGAQQADGVDAKIAPQAATNGPSKANGSMGHAVEDTPRPHKVIIFSQYHMCLDLVESLCSWRGYRTLRLDGSTSRIMRELDMRDFNSDDEDYFVYIIGTRAGGLGINLHSANHVVLFDHDWNPHVDSQAIDRAHRIGQNRTVNIHRLITEWSVEERLVHRQEQKLKIEKCVVNHKSQFEDEHASDVNERLSGEEVLEMLMHGESTLRQFPGESLSAKSLQELLDRVRRPLLEEGGEIPEIDDDLRNAEVEDEDTVRQGQDEDANGAREDEIAEVGSIAIQQAEPVLEPPVRMSRSGRIIRPVVHFQQQQIEVTPIKRKKKVVLKHDKVCFVCGLRSKPLRSLDTGEHDGDYELPEMECSVCPKAYHRDCLPPDARAPKNGRWACGWHNCKRCLRGTSACGGMLMTCLLCPSASCYDCFPPHFRRVEAEPRFWTDLQKKGWNMNAQKMILFNCNACLALAEQQKRQSMREEDLEAQNCARKRQALEEKRSFAERKRKRESEESRRRLRQVMVEHERGALVRAMREVQERLREQLDRLLPAKVLDSIRAKKSYSPMPLCGNCCFPGHRFDQCPMPRERLTEAKTKASVASAVPDFASLAAPDEAGDADAEAGLGGVPESGAASKPKSKYLKRLCSICSATTHGRLQCPLLTAEQTREYENRLELLKQLVSGVVEAGPSCAPALAASAENGTVFLLDAARGTLRKVLEPLNLGHLIIEPPPPPSAIPKVPKVKKVPIKKFRPVKLKIPMKPKFAPRGNMSPKAKAKLKAKLRVRVRAKRVLNGASHAKTSDQTNGTPDMMLAIADGIAAGWHLRGSCNSQGTLLVTYKRPGESRFHGPAIALLDIDAEVEGQLKVERDSLLVEMREKRAAKESEHAVQSTPEERLHKVPRPKKAQELTEERPTKSRRKLEGQGAEQTNGISPGYLHTHPFTFGPADQWIMRIKVTNAGTLSYTYRRPGGQRWESATEAFSEQTPAWDQIASMKEFLAADIRNRLSYDHNGSVAPAKGSIANGDTPKAAGRGRPSKKGVETDFVLAPSSPPAVWQPKTPPQSPLPLGTEGSIGPQQL